MSLSLISKPVATMARKNSLQRQEEETSLKMSILKSILSKSLTDTLIKDLNARMFVLSHYSGTPYVNSSSKPSLQCLGVCSVMRTPTRGHQGGSGRSRRKVDQARSLFWELFVTMNNYHAVNLEGTLGYFEAIIEKV